MLNRVTGNHVVWFFILILFVLMIFSHYVQPKETVKLVYSDFLIAVEQGEATEVVFQGKKISGRLQDGRLFESYGSYDRSFIQELLKKKIKVSEEPESTWFSSMLGWLLPLFIIIIFWNLMLRRQTGRGVGPGAFGFGKSQPRLSTNNQRVTFKDVAGVDEAKQELREVIDFLKNSEQFNRLGAKIPKGVLLMGPPGTGKTLLARAVAGEAGVPFLTISGSDFVEMFVGVGAARVRDLFNQAKTIVTHRKSSCIIFVDEIDAVGRHRGAGLGGGHDEREQTLNQLFVEMDGFDANFGIILIAATNRPDVLDPALLRPGRFDRHVAVGLPDIKGREAILKVHTADKILAENVDLKIIAAGTPGFSGADLANLVNEAALLAGRFGKSAVETTDFEKAKDRVLMGAERKIIISEKEKEIIAYHEAGHAIAAKMVPGADPVHKVTIIPRGRALGLTQQLPLEDRYLISKPFAEGQLKILMAGRAGEEIKFKEFSSGSQEDIKVATNLAEKMICRWGMSDSLGPVSLGKEYEDIFLGRQIVQSRGYSEETARKIDAETKKMIGESLEKAKQMLEENYLKFEALAKALLERETLEGEEIDSILRKSEQN